MSSGEFDLNSVCDLIKEHGYLRVALQFPDELLGKCISIYNYIIKYIENDAVDVFIIGDSTYGSSIDDISAQHVDSDLLVYFGSDLSSSGSMPVIVVPFDMEMNCESCFQQLCLSLDHNGSDRLSSVLLLYELCYSKAIQKSSHFANMANLTIAKVPPSADLSNWDPKASQLPSTVAKNEIEKVGGLLVSSELLNDPNLIVWYIGKKKEQLVSINIRMSEHMIAYFNPMENELKISKGCECLEFRERYGGLLRVKDANIIGIIVGSMGLNSEFTQAIVSRLETLISAAKKSSYVFVMGRLNEAKLCNFPEIDIFCLISNEDVALIKPKTFHVPVVTPWEIEVGLGGRDWEGIFRSDSASILSDVSLEEAVRKVIEALPENPIDSDSDVEVEEIENSQGKVHQIGEQGQKDISSKVVVNSYQMSNSNLTHEMSSVCDSSSRIDCDSNTYSNSMTNTALTLLNSERSIIAFSSPAAEYFSSREFQGLLPIVPDGQDTAIQEGHFGIASTYRRYERIEKVTGADP